MSALRANPAVTFMVAEPFALIPSTYLHPELACPATQFYRSVVVHGEARLVADRAEKAAALEALMQKLQPAGGYAPIRDDARYRKNLDRTAVFALPLDDATAKFKLGQNLPARKRRELARRLAARDAPGDAATVEMMRALGLLESVRADRAAPPPPGP
jgi:predicted FMN-binding regulatory protein PaiB